MSQPPRPRLVHVITGLASGGAEVMLQRLVTSELAKAWDAEVVSLISGGVVAEALTAAGVPVHSLGMQRSLPTPGALFRLRRLLRRLRPDLVQGWMYHGNLAASLAAPHGAGGRVPVVWNIRHTPLPGRESFKPVTRLTIRAGAWFSRRPAAVIYNSAASAARHGELGYRPRREEHIPNGFDTERFRPSREARDGLREELSLAPETPLVGLVGRYHPVKDHPTFLRAAARVRRERPGVCFVLAGRGADRINDELSELLAELGLEDAVFPLGERSDVPRVTAALNVAVCSSLSESFPNVLGEAMACGVPCVTTDVGAAREIVGETGIVVEPGEPEALSEGIHALLGELLEEPVEKNRRRSAAARERIEERYSMASVVEHYDRLYREILGR